MSEIEGKGHLLVTRTHSADFVQHFIVELFSVQPLAQFSVYTHLKVEL